MSISVVLRPAGGSDVRALVAIRRDAILVLATPTYGSERAEVWASSAGDARVHRAIEEREVWVAERGKTTVGWVEVDRDRVEGLYVRPDASGAGVGSELLRHAKGLIRSAGHHAAALDASRNAESFYRRRGYRAQGEEPTEAGRRMVKLLRDGPGAAGSEPE